MERTIPCICSRCVRAHVNPALTGVVDKFVKALHHRKDDLERQKSDPKAWQLEEPLFCPARAGYQPVDHRPEKGFVMRSCSIAAFLSRLQARPSRALPYGLTKKGGRA